MVAFWLGAATGIGPLAASLLSRGKLMRRIAPLFAVTLILVCGLAVAEEAKSTTLNGEYHWTQRD